MFSVLLSWRYPLLSSLCGVRCNTCSLPRRKRCSNLPTRDVCFARLFNLTMRRPARHSRGVLLPSFNRRVLHQPGYRKGLTGAKGHKGGYGQYAGAKLSLYSSCCRYLCDPERTRRHPGRCGMQNGVRVSSSLCGKTYMVRTIC